jgi:hypothetical protein
MSIASFIRDSVFRPRLRQLGCMVVYDADKRYRELCTALASDKIHVVDASESSIESRQAALAELREIGRPNPVLEGVLVYVPVKKPETDEENQRDPFALYLQCGAVFPLNDGDEYQNLCLRAKPDHATQIRRLFAEVPNGPAFSVIDALDSGPSWPHLRGMLRVDSAREILLALLAPSEFRLQALKNEDGWVAEACDFLKITLAMTVKTRAKTWRALSDELWRYLLFSEFAFDLPVELPSVLQGVPKAPMEARPVLEGVCDQLRNDPRSRTTYIERAEGIEQELNLASVCAAIQDLGHRDTFLFEERTFLQVAINGIMTNDTDVVRRVLNRQKNSVWLGKGESQAQWELVRAGLSLVEACEDYDRQLPDHSRSLVDLIDFYVGSLREIDRIQREFEQAVGDGLDLHQLLTGVIEHARKSYRRLAEKVQSVFVKHVETTGWPPTGRMANTDVFDRLVSERLKESGQKIAYLMVDALRYELGVALEKLLLEDGTVELHAAYAQLPTITPVGMASLLPGARTDLSLTVEGQQLLPTLSGKPVANVDQRMDVLQKRYGDRFHDVTLKDFVRGKPKIPETVDLLVLRSTEIDKNLENNPETTLQQTTVTLKRIRQALHKLRGMGFKEAVIVTDHGFFLNAQAEAGDVCVKPQGSWFVNAHDRMLLGDGMADHHSVVTSSQHVGIRGDFTQVAFPRSMAPYRAGYLYFHGGISLAEAVVPVLIARLDTGVQPEPRQVRVAISYKNGAKRITTRLPVLDVMLVVEDFFSLEASVEILLEAQDPKGNVIGEPRPSADVNPATRTVTLIPNQRKQIPLRMEPDYEGTVVVKVLNPTTLASYAALTLETEYTV